MTTWLLEVKHTQHKQNGITTLAQIQQAWKPDLIDADLIPQLTRIFEHFEIIYPLPGTPTILNYAFHCL